MMEPGTKANDVEAATTSPAEIKPHAQVTLKLLPGKNCEVENCGRPAYLVCGEAEEFNTSLYPFLLCCCMKKIEQCKRNCCEKHL